MPNCHLRPRPRRAHPVQHAAVRADGQGRISGLHHPGPVGLEDEVTTGPLSRPATIRSDHRAVPAYREEDMRHPPSVWADPAYADEPLDELRAAYLA